MAAYARTWLAAKSLDGSAHSHDARLGDLCRVARALHATSPRPTPDASRSRAGEEARDDLARLWGPLDKEDLEVERLVDALAWMRERYEAVTIARTLSTLRSWCRFLVRTGFLEANPCDDELVRAPTVYAVPVELHALSGEDFDAMVAAAGEVDPKAPSAWPERDVAVLETLAGCGLRAAELCGLTVASLVRADHEGGRSFLRVVTGAKGGRSREVPVPERVSAALAVWRQARRDRATRVPALDETFTPALFVTTEGGALDVARLDRLVRRVARRAGVRLPDGACAHAFRHLYGVELAVRGVPLTVIAQLCGHADVRVTSRYTRAAGGQLWAALDEAGWL